MLTGIVILCVVLAALCAAIEHALAEASRAKLDDMLQGEQQELIDRLLQRDHELSLSAIIYRAVLETGAIVTLAVTQPLGELSAYAAFGWAAALVLVFVEIVPRLLAARSPERILIRALPIFYALSLPILPVTAGVLVLTRVVRKTNGQADEEQDEAAEDILSAVTEGEKEGSIAEDQADMIENIIELRDADVAEIMTPRPDMTSVSTEDPLDKTIALVLESGHSRLPVFRNTRDDIVGVLYVRDLIAAISPDHGERPSLSTESLMRPPYFVPETMQISDLLREFQRRKATMAVVVDEYGGTAGLVTVSDIVQTIVGEVRDHDEPPREPVVKIIDERCIEADARTPVRRLNEDFGAAIPESDEYDTVAGYLCYALGRIPQVGDHHTADDMDIAVLEADERHVESIRITVQSGIRSD